MTEQPISPYQTPKRSWFMLMFMLIILCSLVCGAIFLYQQKNTSQVEVMTREAIVSKIQSLNRLQTVAYNVDSIIHSHKQGNWYALWQDEQKGLFLAHGRVLAGIDLNQLTAEQVVLSEDGKTVNITLPSAQVFETYLDNIEVYDIKTGVFGMMTLDPDLFHLAQQEGKKQILSQACQSHILTLATENAQKQVKGLFELANLQVNIQTTDAKSCV